jgi:hypothetical protein
MGTKKSDIEKRLISLLTDYSMPEIVETLLKICEDTEKSLKKEKNSEHQFWGHGVKLFRKLLVEID